MSSEKDYPGTMYLAYFFAAVNRKFYLKKLERKKERDR